MVFSSLEFLFLYFAVTILIYYIVPLNFRNIVLLLVSLAFYGWGEPVYVVIMLYSICIDYVCGYFAGKYRETNKKKAKKFVIASAILNLSVLAFFKYYTFIVTNIQLLPFEFLQKIPTLADVKLPIGISFYTFQTMSYTIDIYRGDAKVQKNIASFGAYVTLFPQLIAGPIVRYQDVDDQLRHRPHNIDMFASGMRTFVCGFAKKILLANCAGELWDSFREASAVSPTVLGSWMGLIFYAFQIYFDFSAYSDMAIGLGKMLGFTFKENFYYPYISKSITEFWRRWHISMGTWFREYVYIPLGGNRCSKFKMYRNILIVWFLTGLWHGASWNFVLWGLYYCLLLVIEKTFLLKALKKIPAFFSHLYTLVFVLFGWLLFVSADIPQGGITYLTYMFGGDGLVFTNAATTFDVLRSIVLVVILCVASTPLPKTLYYKFYKSSKAARVTVSIVAAAVLVVCTGYLVDSSYNPFLYFRF